MAKSDSKKVPETTAEFIAAIRPHLDAISSLIREVNPEKQPTMMMLLGINHRSFTMFSGSTAALGAMLATLFGGGEKFMVQWVIPLISRLVRRDIEDKNKLN